MTLLVLELKVPQLASSRGAGPTSSDLIASLQSQWPSYFAFLTSFFTVLIMWVHHHTIFRLVHRTDAALLFANGVLLLLVTLVPFPTAVVSTYLRTPAAPAACTLYAGVFVLIAIAFYVVLLAAFRGALLAPNASAAMVRRLRRSYRLGPPAYLLATVVAPFSPFLALCICTALWIFWAAVTGDQRRA